MKIYEIWESGHQIVVDALENAAQGKLPGNSTLNQLGFIAIELKKQLRLIESEIEGLDADNWAPWRGGEQLMIQSSWDLESACNLWEREKAIPPCERDAIAKWAQACRAYFSKLDAAFQKTTMRAQLEGPCEPNTWQFKGEAIANLTFPPTAFALVKYLWDCKDRTASLDELAEPVFGDHSRQMDIAKIQDHAKAANNVFRKYQLNWSITTFSKPYPKACLVNLPPK